MFDFDLIILIRMVLLMKNFGNKKGKIKDINALEKLAEENGVSLFTPSAFIVKADYCKLHTITLPRVSWIITVVIVILALVSVITTFILKRAIPILFIMQVALLLIQIYLYIISEIDYRRKVKHILSLLFIKDYSQSKLICCIQNPKGIYAFEINDINVKSVRYDDNTMYLLLINEIISEIKRDKSKVINNNNELVVPNVYVNDVEHILLEDEIKSIMDKS